MTTEDTSLFGITQKGIMILLKDAGVDINENEAKNMIKKVRAAWKPPGKEVI